jgi:hypothetical protein
MFPGATVEAAVNNSSQVSVELQAPFKANVVSVAQRDLYRKYGWPAEPAIRSKLEMLKDELSQ